MNISTSGLLQPRRESLSSFNETKQRYLFPPLDYRGPHDAKYIHKKIHSFFTLPEDSLAELCQQG